MQFLQIVCGWVFVVSRFDTTNAFDRNLFTEVVHDCPAVRHLDVIGKSTHVQCGIDSPEDCCRRQQTFFEDKLEIQCNIIVAEGGCCTCYDTADDFVYVDRDVVTMIKPNLQDPVPDVSQSHKELLKSYLAIHNLRTEKSVPATLLKNSDDIPRMNGPIKLKSIHDSETMRCSCSVQDSTSCSCPPGSGTQERTFYLYSAIRSSTRDRRSWGNKNFGSLAGVLYYIHNEVVIQSCPRLFHISEIARIKVTMLNTPHATMFPFESFAIYDYGMCELDQCLEIYNQSGYTVGCQNQKNAKISYDVFNENGHQTLSPLVWFSLPGSCPHQPYDQKSEHCKSQFPGGECSAGETIGTGNCTWTAELAGHVTLNELYNITDEEYENTWCRQQPGIKEAQRGIEYSKHTDSGLATSFWNDAKSPVANAKRVMHAQNVFSAKYPDDEPLLAPLCTHTLEQTTRFMTWNVWNEHNAQNDSIAFLMRVNEIAQSIQASDAQIWSVQALGEYKAALMTALGTQFKFATHPGDSGLPDTLRDGDVLYRSDLWEEEGSGVAMHAETRGISWAALKNVNSSMGVLVYGVHAPCCDDDSVVLELVEAAVAHMVTTKKKYPYPVVLMGDMSAEFHAASQRLLLEGMIDDNWNADGQHVLHDGTVDDSEYGERRISLRFTDAWAATHVRNLNEHTNTKTNTRTDYVYVEQVRADVGIFGRCTGLYNTRRSVQGIPCVCITHAVPCEAFRMCVTERQNRMLSPSPCIDVYARPKRSLSPLS